MNKTAAMQTIRLNLNGKTVEVLADPAKRLSDLLRDDLGLTGTKIGCHSGDCGACTVHGLQMINDAEVTIRNVSRGILGVSFIQAVMLGVGFLLAGIPGAGLWAMLAFFLAIIQIGVGPIVAIGLIYAFLKLSMFIAIPLAVWCGVIFMIDNVLKPIMLGKGAPVPMVVIFLGAIGGFISFGIIGLFVGAVVLSLGYNLFIIWLD